MGALVTNTVSNNEIPVCDRIRSLLWPRVVKELFKPGSQVWVGLVNI